jgi:unsaturated rhamnogalacturonyl hydrolase
MRLRSLLLLVLIVGCPDPEPEPAPHDTLGGAQTLADQAQDRWRAGEIGFDWVDTVLAYGMHRLHATTEAPQWQAYYRIWQTTAVGDLPDMLSSDSMSPATLASILMVEDSSIDLTVTTDAAHAYLDAVQRTDEGAIAHWGEDHPLFGDTRQVWIDSMFMWGIFLLSEFERTGDRAHVERFVEQYELFSDLCRSDANLYHHAYDDETDSHIPVEEAFWARGNAWVLIAGAELLARLPDDPAADTIRPLFLSHVDATLAVQADSGRWLTVMNSPRGDDPGNYEETSATALIGYALARAYRAGALDDDVLPGIQAALEGLAGRVVEEPDGHLTLQGTSFGTNPGEYEDYLAVPLLDDQIVGVGAAIMFLAEAHGLPSVPTE